VDLQALKLAHPRWTISVERGVWTATAKPTPTSLWFKYAADLSQLERELAEADSPPG
jgi:hypothetical protein